MNMPENTRSLEERLYESSFRHEAAEDAAKALAAKDKLLGEAMKTLEHIEAQRIKLPTGSRYVCDIAGTALANLKAEMEDK